jgi:GNAT superfamily N-acetyltransferase
MADFLVREAQISDVAGMAKVRVDTWLATYRGIVPDEFLDAMSVEEVTDGWKRGFFESRQPGVALYAAENAQKEIIGVAVCGPESDQDPVHPGEIYILYVLPAYQGQGVGQQLFAACVQHLTSTLHVNSMLIWTYAESPYHRFYEKLGGKVVREASSDLGGRMIPELCFAWDDLAWLSLE